MQVRSNSVTLGPVESPPADSGDSGGGGGGGGGFGGSGPAVAPPIAGNPLTAGTSHAVVDRFGMVQESTAQVSPDRSSMALTVRDARVELSGQGNTFEDQKPIQSRANSELRFNARGLEPDSLITAYLISTRLFNPLSLQVASNGIFLLGSATVDQEGNLDADFKLAAVSGEYLLQLTTTLRGAGEATFVLPLTLQGGSGPAGQARGWTRDFGNNQLKLYTREIIGAGKVRFVVNGREIAWVRAVDGNDRKLNVAGDGMVRTVTAVPGRNVFEIYVGDERVVRRIFTRR
jgi:hypothetical protein